MPAETAGSATDMHVCLRNVVIVIVIIVNLSDLPAPHPTASRAPQRRALSRLNMPRRHAPFTTGHRTHVPWHVKEARTLKSPPVAHATLATLATLDNAPPPCRIAKTSPTSRVGVLVAAQDQLEVVGRTHRPRSLASVVKAAQRVAAPQQCEPPASHATRAIRTSKLSKTKVCMVSNLTGW